jgi:hypothetical protein
MNKQDEVDMILKGALIIPPSAEQTSHAAMKAELDKTLAKYAEMEIVLSDVIEELKVIKKVAQELVRNLDHFKTTYQTKASVQLKVKNDTS